MRRFLIRLLIVLLIAVIITLIAFRLSAVWRETGTKLIPPSEGTMISTPLGTLYTLARGPADGTPLLLAHGTAAWSGFWAPQVAALAEDGFRATAFDLPPFGYSDRAADGDYTRTRQADRILALTRTFPDRPIMIAHSFGAAAATEAVLREPDAFAGLIIIAGALAMAETPTQAKLPLPLRPRLLRETALSLTATNPMATEMLLRGLLYNKDAVTDQIIRTLQAPQRRAGTTAAYADWLPALLAPRADALSRTAANYADLPLPVRIIWGDQDTITPPAQAEALAKAIGQQPVIYIENVGHIPHIEAPDVFMTTLRAVLKEMRQAR